VLWPVIGSIAFWWLQSATLVPGQCANGNTELLGTGELALVFFPAAMIAFRLRRATGSLRGGWAPMLMSFVLAVVLMMVSAFLWAGSHDCYG
jgi:hypothetical protein